LPWFARLRARAIDLSLVEACGQQVTKTETAELSFDLASTRALPRARTCSAASAASSTA